MTLPFASGPTPSRASLGVVVLAVVMLCGATVWSVVGRAVSPGEGASGGGDDGPRVDAALRFAPLVEPEVTDPSLAQPIAHAVAPAPAPAPVSADRGPVVEGATLLAVVAGRAAVIRFESPDVARGAVDYRYWLDDASDGWFNLDAAVSGFGGVREGMVPEVMAGPIHLEWTGDTVEPFSHPACSQGPRAVRIAWVDWASPRSVALDDAALAWVGGAGVGRE